MKNLIVLITGLTFTAGASHAQIVNQPAQAVQQPVQSVPAGQTQKLTTSQNQPLQSTPQSSDQIQPAVTPSANPVPQATQTTPDGQVITAPVVPGTVTTTEETTVIPQQVNGGQVPKVYTNTQEQLPFRQYQPKPTGQISPASGRRNSAPAVR